MPLSVDFLNNPQQFCTNYVTTIAGTTIEDAQLPVVGFAGGAFQNTGTFFNNRSAGGSAVKTGYDVAANSSDVCWHEYETGKVRLIRRNSNAHVTLTGGGIALNDWFPAYFLPWGSGKIGRMLIPAQGAAVVNPVRAFFTAEMNGCSFFAGGSRRSPVVAHYNVGPNADGTPLTQDDKDQIQNAMVKSLIDKNPLANLSGKRVAALRWLPPTHAADATTGAQIASSQVNVYGPLAAEGLAAEQRIAAAIAAQNAKLVAGPANPSGVITNIRVAMMGTMDTVSRRWTFFYQRNFYTQSNYIAKLGKRGGWIKFRGNDNRQVQTLVRFLHIAGWEYTELWPNGAGVMRMPAHGDPRQ
jgi:hypothetical protein